MKWLFVRLARWYIEQRERELGRPISDSERNRIALLAGLPLLLFALFCFWMASR